MNVRFFIFILRFLFGTPNPNLKRKELLGEIYETLLTLKVSTICMPTFTFSFCNGKDYDPRHSGSKMGALNEYFRKQDGVIRSVDPLMSVLLCLEKNPYFFVDIKGGKLIKEKTFLLEKEMVAL